MRWVRGLIRAAGAVTWFVALAPLLALVPAAVFDRGPTGPARLTPFPIALAALDPFVWLCARNSLLLAASVSLASGLVGVPLARAVAGWRFWGRRPLAVLACVGLAVPPAFGAIGLRTLTERFLPATESGFDAFGWVAWFLAALATAAPAVGLTAAAALRDVSPAWSDAARWAGAGHRRTWRRLVWPVVRTDVGKALGLVFAWTLLDPTAPLVLGLRRTLGFQVAASARAAHEPGQLGRAVVLTLMGLALAFVGRELIRGWAGTRAEIPETARPEPRLMQAGWKRGALLGTGFLIAAGLASLPLAGLVAASLSFQVYLGVVSDPLIAGYLAHSAWLGAAVVAADVLLAGTLLSLAPWLQGRAGWLAGWSGSVPPLAVGVGVLALPHTLLALADAFAPGTSTGFGPPPDAIRSLAALVDIDRSPFAALVLGTAVARSTLMVRSAVERRNRVGGAAVQAAIVLGATPGRARRKLTGRWLFGASPAAVVLTFSLAATNPLPALVLSPTAETRPVGPAVVALAAEPDGTARSSALAVLAVSCNVAALGLAFRGRVGLVRCWLRA